MLRRRSRLAPERQQGRSLSERVEVQGSRFKVENSEGQNSELRKVNNGTTDQCHRFVLSVVDAVRGDRPCGGVARTVAVSAHWCRSLCWAAGAGLFESGHSRHARTLGDFLQRLTLWLKITLHQIRVPAA